MKEKRMAGKIRGVRIVISNGKQKMSTNEEEWKRNNTAKRGEEERQTKPECEI